MFRATLAFLRAYLRVTAPTRTIRSRTRLRVEPLEDRVTPSAGLREQYMLELINRMRANPAAELPLLLNSTDPNVNSALDFFNVDIPTLQSQWSSLVPAPPLAWNDALALAARNHNQAMLTAGVQAHQVAGESALGTRITNAGYSNWNTVGENIFAYADSVFQAHAAFAIDWGNTATGIQSPPGHRQNLMSTNFRDVGIGVLDATGNSNLGPLLITQDFGNRFSYGNPYLLGVVYNDANSNGYYDQGEGLSNVTLTITGAGGPYLTTTTNYGGYQIALPAGSYSVVATGGALNAPVASNVTLGSSNVRANFINGSPPPQNGSVPFSDDFNRSGSSVLGLLWSTRSGGVRIASNTAVGNVAGSLATVNGVVLADSTIQADVNVTGAVNQNAGVVARYVNNNNNYVARVLHLSTGYSIQIYKKVAGSWTQLASAPVSSGVGTIRFDVVGSSLKAFYGVDASNLALVAFAFDNSLSAPGNTGIWATTNACIDNFTVDAIAVPTSQSLPFTDTFVANAPTQQLSNNWRERGGNFGVAGGAALAIGPTVSLATLRGVTLANVATQAEITLGASQNTGLVARYQINGNYYLAFVAANTSGTSFTANLYKSIGGVFTKLNVGVASLPSGVGTLRFEAVGASMKLFFGPNAGNLSLIAYAFDSSITTAGQVGIRARVGARLDNFTIDTIVTANASLPFSDAFTQAIGSQLSRSWTERSGNFGVASNALIGNDAGANLATLNGLAIANAVIQADINLSANQAAGVIGRNQSNGSYYLAQIKANSSGTAFTAQLYKFTGGFFTLLRSAAVGSGTGTLRLVMSGASLQIYFGADSSIMSLALSVTDTSITAAGLVGIRGAKNSIFDNFIVT